MKDIDWLLDCEPREVQLEALRRSYLGLATRAEANGPTYTGKLPHFRAPAPGWGHFMEMRLGKTATALNEFMLLKRDHGIKRALIVCPNAFKRGWEDEAIRFGVDVPVHVFESSNREAALNFSRRDEGIVVVNYESLVHQNTCAILDKWANNDESMVIADESVKIKNPKSVTFKNLMAITKDTKYTRALTGLPTPQDVTDLWSQLRFVKKLKGVNFYAFRGKFAKMGGYMNKKVTGVRNEDELTRLINNCAFVASRRKWGGFIETDYMTVDVEMTPKQKASYIMMEKEFVVWLDNGVGVSADQVLAKYMKLQQISSGFVLDELGKPMEIEPFESTNKFKHLKEALSEEINGKTVIVARYRHTIDMLTKHLHEFKPAVIRGSEDMKTAGIEVEKEKHRFNNDLRCRVLIGQVSAIKYGHTLIGNDADPCNTVVFYENSYSLDDRAQAEQRPQGFAQKTGIVVIDYASTKIEKEIVGALQKKDKIAKTILGHYKPEYM